MSYLGSWKIDDLLSFYAQTQAPTGVATDADAVPGYRIYEDETGTPLLTGSMALLDDVNTIGFYSEQVTLSAANGFEKGKCYAVRVTATVGGVAGAKVDTFQIEAEVDAHRLNWANIDNPTTAQNLSATNIDVDQVVASVSGAVGSVTGAVGSVTGAVGSVAAGGITAASIATGAIDADALAVDAVAEIADGVWDEDATGHQTQGTFGQAIGDPGADADTIWGLANTNLDAAVSTRATPAQVNTEVLDVLNVDTFAEVGQETPAATQTLRKMLAYLYKAWRNRATQTDTAYKLYADDATTVDQKATVSDDGVTYDSGEKESGP